MIRTVSLWGKFSLVSRSSDIEVLVGAGADEDLADDLSVEVSVSAETERNFLVKRVDEEI